MNKPSWKSLFHWGPWALPWAWLGYAGVLGFGLMALIVFTGAMLHHGVTQDFPWLLATGQEILQHHRLPSGDIYSWTSAGKPWVLYQWAFEVSLAWKANVYGIPALIRGFALWGIAFYVLIPLIKDGKRGIPLGYTWIIGALALLTTTINLSLRPMMVTVYFLALQYGILQGLKSQRLSSVWSAVLLGLVYLMWGNMHTGVVIGLLSLGLFAAGDALEARHILPYQPENPEFHHRKLSPKRYGLLGLVAIGASLINPYGPLIYTYLGSLSGQGYMNNSIQELQSPDFHQAAYQCFLVLMVLFFSVLPRLRKSLPVYAWLHLLVFTAVTLFVQRFVVWTVLFYAYMLPQGLYLAWHQSLPQGVRSWWRSLDVFRPALVSLVIVAGAVFWWHPATFHAPPVRMSTCETFQNGLNAYQHLKKPGDRLFNDAEVGSCMLLYHPEQPVFIDTRFDFYGTPLMRETRQTVAMSTDLETTLSRWKITTLVLKQTAPLTHYLKSQPGYRLLYEDKAIALFRRQSNTVAPQGE